MEVLQQTWTLMKKDLLIVGRRNWLSTLLRAFILPVIVTFILGYAKIIRGISGVYGVQDPFTLMSLHDAFEAGSASKFAIVDHNLPGDDVQAAIKELTTTALLGGIQNVLVTHDVSELRTFCPASRRGVTDCFAAVEFLSSPDSAPNAIWNYTLHYDSNIGNTFNVKSNQNPVQIYTLPLQHAIDSIIATSHGGPGLPNNIQQYGFTYTTEAGKEKENQASFDALVESFLAWAFFVGICGTTYHLTGFVTHQREKGLLQLIDAMMPNKSRWHCLAARILSTHLAFDLIYLPGWIVMGAITGGFTFPNTGAGWYILLYILGGLALTSYSILAGSLFRREQLAAISAIIAAFVFALAAQFGEVIGARNVSPAGVLTLAVLFPPSTFVYFVLLTAKASRLFSINVEYSTVSAGALLGLLVFQIVVYPIIGAIIEKFLHGHSSRSRYIRTRDEMGNDSVRLTGFSKHYNIAARKRDRVIAVDDLSLSLHAGSITVLLGTNGSGKTTTLNSIAGLETMTTGQIEIDGTGGIGLCPQKNVHWGDMTVEDHVRFFEKLKRPSFGQAQSSQEVARILSGCDLDLKKNARAKTLSGGQMRKLQLAMMLAGGSQVCCIDEASSGIDPLARRKVWEILLRERGQRTMLLTTHFLDETEVLSDHVAILSKGKLKAEGSVASLKNQFGGGYHVLLSHHDVSNRLQELPPGITHSKEYNNTVLVAPDASMLTPLLSELEHSGISDYRIRGPTIEDVFLALAEEMKIEKTEAATLVTSRAIDSGISDALATPANDSIWSTMKLNTGKGCGPVKQTGILFLKRLTVLKHNFMPYVAALFVPLVLAGMVTRLFIDKPYPYGLPCSSTSGDSYSTDFGSLYLAEITDYGVFGPQSKVSEADLEKFIPDVPPQSYDGGYSLGYYSKPLWSLTQFVDSLDDFNTAIQDSVARSNSRWGGFYIGNEILFAYQGLDSQLALWAQASLHTLLSNVSFEVNAQSFQQAFVPQDIVQGVVAILTVLGFTLYPGLFALYPTAERLRNVRAMQYSNGILSSSLWLAYALFDFMFIVLISVLATVIWAACYHGWYALEYVFVVFLLYGMAATAYSYLISLFVKSQLAAIACTSLVQTVIAMLFFVGYFVTVDHAPLTEISAWFNYIYYTIGLICPAVSLFRALLITLNVYGLACKGPVKAANPGAIDLFGGPILYLTVQIVVLVMLLMFWESGRSLEVFGIRRSRDHSIVEEITDRNHHVLDDEKHLALSKDGLRLFNLTKSFGATRAVENVSLGVLPSEKFALLGPNGAGKSTTISLIRGELRPDSTDPPAAVYISGDSLMHAPVAAKNHLGVCPQFDAVDSMTLSEHLHFYARARGVPNKNTNIQELITILGLDDHANKLVKKLSGGTKRKLSLAIALIANPSVLLLDEPSSGMDPAAKRALWSTLTSISAGRCLLLTTHSMEEAAALCDRAGIMATKMLALGTIPDLCAQHGDKIYVHIVHQNAPYTTAGDMEKIWQWVKSTFIVAEAEERTYGGQLRFAVPIQTGTHDQEKMADGNDMARLFRMIEDKKAEMGIRDYSIGPTTLDQVFLNVVSKHDVEEESAALYKESGWTMKRLFRRNSCSKV